MMTNMDEDQIERYRSGSLGFLDEMEETIRRKREALSDGNLHENYRLAGVISHFSEKMEEIDREAFLLEGEIPSE